MSSPLYDLKKEDWNRLFPIHLVEHDPNWKLIFQKERELILAQLANFQPVRIEHVGSTSIPGIMAKPYIDILIVVAKELMFSQELIDAMTGIGFTYFLVPKLDQIESYMSFGKGYNLEGKPEQIFHIHLCPNHNFMVNQVEFRDRLRANPSLANAYNALKRDSAEKFRNDRGGYRNSKSDFILEVLGISQKSN
jgi:GrpB-like predicted nucleotidyltransferase (UPF0157 family)